MSNEPHWVNEHLFSWLLGLLATLIVGVVLTMTWAVKKIFTLDSWQDKADDRITAFMRECQNCRERISDIVKIASKMEESDKRDKDRDKLINSTANIISTQARDLTEVRERVTRIEGKVDEVTDLLRNGINRNN